MATDDTNVSLEQFVERLLAEKGVTTTVPETVKNQMKEDLLTRLYDTINAKTIAAMSESDVEGFSKLLDTNPSQEHIQQYIEGKVPGGATFLATVLMDFRKTYLGLA